MSNTKDFRPPEEFAAMIASQEFAEMIASIPLWHEQCAIHGPFSTTNPKGSCVLCEMLPADSEVAR